MAAGCGHAALKVLSQLCSQRRMGWGLFCQSVAAIRQVGTLMPCMGLQLLERSASVLTLLRGLQARDAVQQPPCSAHLS